MNKEHASKGYKVVPNTTAVTNTKFYGFQVIAEAVISSITDPTDKGHEGDKYTDDGGTLATQTLPVGYYPIRGSGITLTSGKVILYLE